MTVKIFLSHSHQDRAIAGALAKLITDIFGGNVSVTHSSDQAAGGGIPPGAKWLPWVTEHIQAADYTYVLLTPNSMNRPWVLWESGAAAGVALASDKLNSVVPITFGLEEDDIPSLFDSLQIVRGDSDQSGGIERALQEINSALGASSLGAIIFSLAVTQLVPPFLTVVKKALEQASALDTLLASIPSGFPATALSGLWATAYRFTSNAAVMHHADLAQVVAHSERRIRATNNPPRPRTEGHRLPFLNEVQAELASRHVLGHWKNLSDTRYFGTLHLAVLTGENVMDGHYTAFDSDVSTSVDCWRWVRIDPGSVAGVDLATVTLREPAAVFVTLLSHTKDDGALTLDAVIEPQGAQP